MEGFFGDHGFGKESIRFHGMVCAGGTSKIIHLPQVEISWKNEDSPWFCSRS